MISYIKKIRFHAHQFSLELTCGMIITYPLDWFPALADARIEDLKNHKITGNNIDWPTLGFNVSFEDLLLKFWDSGLLKEGLEKTEGPT